MFTTQITAILKTWRFILILLPEVVKVKKLLALTTSGAMKGTWGNGAVKVIWDLGRALEGHWKGTWNMGRGNMGCWGRVLPWSQLR